VMSLGVAQIGSAEAGVGPSSPPTPSHIRLHAPPPFRPMSGSAHSKAESPRLSPNSLKGALVSANQLLRPDLPRRRKSEAAAAARPRYRFGGRIGRACGPEIGRIRVRLVTCMPRCSCAAGIRSDCGQKGSAIRTPRRPGSAEREEASWCLRM